MHFTSKYAASMIMIVFVIGLMAANAATHYLVPPGAVPVNPYDSWATAATSVIDVVNAAMTNATTPRIVRVTNGVYVLTNNVTITNNVVMQSVNGRAATIFNGNALYHFNLQHTNCILEGLTITNGCSTSGGGGINIRGGIVTNCLITACQNNPTTWGNSGGGIYIAGTGVVVNSIIRGNIATNSIDGEGGGISLYSGAATIENCIIENNIGRYGVGIMIRNIATIRNCLIRNNSLTNSGVAHGGGIHVGNSSTNTRVINCTIVSNYSSSYSGGVSFGSDRTNVFINCIIYSNKCAVSPVANDIYMTTFGNGPSAFAYSCSTSTNIYFVIGGMTGNKTNNPGFVGFAGGNYRFNRSSPCFNSGTNQTDWMNGAVDLDGHPRILHGTVDMGAYELFIPRGTMISVR